MSPIKNIFKRRSEKNRRLTESLKKITGFSPAKHVYYEKAFTHRSANRKDELGNPISYERLEFLGDAILSAVVAHYLFDKVPSGDEGYLTKLRTKIVNGKMLGFLANKLELNKYAIMSKQVENANGRNNNSIMEDIFEAFIGAILIDYKDIENDTKSISGKGYYIAEKWIIAVMEKHIDFSELICTSTNFKDKRPK